MPSVWRVEMLGGLQARAHGLTVSRFRTRRVAMLLAFLALHRDRFHSRDEITELLWPDADDPEAARRNLRQALHSLRKALEPPSMPAGSVLEVKQSLIRISSEILTTDVSEMERLVDMAREAQSGQTRFDYLKQALALYRGDLLPGFDELWVMNERFRMEDLYLSTLSRIIDECEHGDRGDEAIHYLRLALAKEPLNEVWHTALMRRYLASKRPNSALKQYEELAEILRQELRRDPDDEAKKLARIAQREIGRATPVDPPPKTRESEPEAAEPELQPLPQERLPIQLTRLFGRDEEIEAVSRQFTTGAARLLTILGPAGTGKTRLSIEAGRTLADQEGWEAWFVPLAEISDESLILDRVLDAIQPRRRDRKNPLAAIRDALNRERTLLILDNLEHIVEKAAPVIADLLKAAPKLSILATSRQSLNLEGERQYQLHPLPIPADLETARFDTRAQIARLAEYPSIQMLVDRCQAIRPDVQLTLNNARHFAAICAKLEGVPLAIEIAAGLSKTSTPAQIVKQLENRLAVLTSRRRDISARHHSLRAAIDYGFQTLTPNLQRFFASLSVFRGGFSVDAAHQVCYRTLSTANRASCLNSILDLQERSLLQVEENSPDDAELRFRMLETFREYGDEHLTEEERQTLRGRHVDFYLATHLDDAASKNPDARARLHLQIEQEYDNYLAALKHLYDTRQIEPLMRLLATIATAWDVRGTKSVEQNYIREVARLPETKATPPADQVQLLRMLGTTYLRQSDFQSAYQACSDALEVALGTESDDLIASCYFGMALCAGYLGWLDQCIELCRKVLEHAPKSNGVMLERTYVSIGSAHWSRDEFAKAEEAFNQARQISQDFRGGEPDALIFTHLAGLHIDQGRLDLGMREASEGVRISRRQHNDIGLSASLAQVARYHWRKENFPAADATSREALAKARDTGISMLCLEVIRGHALIQADQGRYEPAATLIAASQGLESMAKLADQRDAERALAEIRAELSPESYEQAWARGLGMDLDEAFQLALASN